ncbi:hypothetical protein BH10PSE13_BH10PSE13_05240 [soil metagenome]
MEGRDTLAVRWTPSTKTIVESRLNSTTFDAQIICSRRTARGEGLFNPRWAFIQMFFGRNELATASYGHVPNPEHFVHQGRIFCVPQGAELHCRWEPGVQRGLLCMFDIEGIAQRHGIDWSWDNIDKTKMLSINNEHISASMRRISEELASPSPHSSIVIEISLMTAILELSRDFSEASKPKHGSLSASEHRMLNDLYMDAYAPFPEIVEVAAILGTNSRNLAELFRDTTGQTLRSFIAKARIERAKILLVDREYLIKQIAFKCGFDSFSSFCGAFRGETGQSPSAYRAAAWSGIIAASSPSRANLAFVQ